MGKDLKGKELGIGISQRKDGYYTARFTDKNGTRRQKYFKKLQECRKWIADAQFEDEHGGIDASGDMSVSAWFDYWMENIKGNTIKSSTKMNYRMRFENNVKDCIGTMLLNEVKPVHCQNVLNRMSSGGYCTSSIKATRNTMFNFFEDAFNNDLILKNPVSKIVCAKGAESKEKRVLSVSEQKIFVDFIRSRSYYNQYALILQTGLRVGELTGLKWDDVDFDEKILHVKRTADYRTGKWELRSTKTKSGSRDIPLTEEAVKILKSQKSKILSSKVISMDYKDLVFLSANGRPIKNSTYHKDLDKICAKLQIKHFSIHALRHTFATRCIEAGMKPKTLQKILGHSDIGMTMNLYVHITEDEKKKEIMEIENVLNVI